MARKESDPRPAKEDVKKRFAGAPAARLDDGVAELNTPTPVDAEESAITDTEDELEAERIAAELERERLAKENAGAAAIPTLAIPEAPPLPPGTAPDPYTAALLQGFKMIGEQIANTNRLILQQNERAERRIAEDEASKPIPIHKVKPVTPWNPEGRKDRLKLTRPVFLSGYPLQPSLMTEEEIQLANQLKPGRYRNRTWEIVQYNDGTIDFRYPNRSIEARMEMARIAPDLVTLFKLVIKEQEDRAAKRIVDAVGDYD